jgi:hypothetical protein
MSNPKVNGYTSNGDPLLRVRPSKCVVGLKAGYFLKIEKPMRLMG